METIKIEFGDIKIGNVAKQHIKDCLDSNRITMGVKVKLFEEKWRSLFKYDYCTMVNSGTSAGIAACMALYEFGSKPNDEIICPALSFIATGNAIRAAGFKPVFVDVGMDMQIDVNKIVKAITSKTRAIKVVNLMGKPCQLEKVKEIAEKHNLMVIVDNCEGMGSKRKGEYSLSYADMETSSHYIAHICMSCEGGTVTSKRADINEIIQSARSHGRIGGSLYFNHVRYGLNLKPSDLHASIGLEQVDEFWNIYNTRKRYFKYLYDNLAFLNKFMYFVEEDIGDDNCPHAFSMIVKPEHHSRIDGFKNALSESGIHWKRNFQSFAHAPAFDYLKMDKRKFKNAHYISEYGVHIPCHYYLTEENLEYMVRVIQKFWDYIPALLTPSYVLTKGTKNE